MKERGNSTLRFLDRYLGIPLILFFSLFKRKRKMPSRIASIGLLKSAGIGDVVLLSAIIADIKVRYPKVPIIFFTGPTNEQMARLIEDIEVISLPISNPLQSIKILRKRKPTILLEFDVWPRISPLLTFFSKSQFTVGHRTRGQSRHFLYDKAASHSHECHELENFRKILLEIDVKPAALPNITCKEREVKNQIVLHTSAWGAKGTLREWQKEKWGEIIDTFLEKGIDVILTGGPKEREKVSEIIGNRNAKNLAGKMSLKETADCLASSKLLISVDTGIMHLGAAVGVPVIALHGPSRYWRWGPIGKCVRIVTPAIDYIPCLSLGFEGGCKENRCMQLIGVADVKEAIEEMLN